MEVKASLRNLRIAPRKVRLVADLVRGKSVADARLQLRFNQMRPAKPLLKLLESGVANAQNNHGLDPQTLQIKELVVDQGPMLKRYMARAFGRGAEIQKRMSHIRLILVGQAGVGGQAKSGKGKGKTEVAASADMEKQPAEKKVVGGTKEAAPKKPKTVTPSRPVVKRPNH